MPVPAGSYLGVRLAVFFRGAVQLALFAAAMLAAAAVTLRDRAPPSPGGASRDERPGLTDGHQGDG
ncbi:MAG: hypothetical protein ACE5JR_05890 [Gemmatimonadota bacterium]